MPIVFRIGDRLTPVACMTYTRILFVSPIRYRLNSLDFELITALKDLKKMYPQTTKSVNY